MLQEETKKITGFLETPMPNYVVTIELRVSNLTRWEVENRVRSAFGGNLSTIPPFRISSALGVCAEACASSGHFGCVHWSEADLESKFDELGIPITPEVLSLARSSYLLRHIDDSMVEVGWRVMERAIVEAQSVNDAVKKA